MTNRHEHASMTAAPRPAWDHSEPGAYSRRGRIKVQWVDLGEGRCGDYNPDDPTDEALLRWDAYVYCPDLEQHTYPMHLDPGVDDPWATPDRYSFCTYVPVGTPRTTLCEYAEQIADELDDALDAGTWKRTAERLSWIGVEGSELAPVFGG